MEAKHLQNFLNNPRISVSGGYTKGGLLCSVSELDRAIKEVRSC